MTGAIDNDADGQVEIREVLRRHRQELIQQVVPINANAVGQLLTAISWMAGIHR